jgi:hypothetical protein
MSECETIQRISTFEREGDVPSDQRQATASTRL